MARFYCLLTCFVFYMGISCFSQTIVNFAGAGTLIGDGGPATVANVSSPYGGVFDKFGNYYFVQSFSGPRIRKIDTNNIIYTVAGNGRAGFSGDGGPATAASLNPQGIAVDSIGNIYIADSYNNRIRKVDATTHIITTIAGTGVFGCTGSGGAATAARMTPGAVCIDRNGNLFVLDSGGGKIRKIDTAGIIHNVAGNGTYGFSGDGGQATVASLSVNNSICIDNNGILYLAADKRIRTIDTRTGIINTIAGNGNWYYIGAGMRADSAQFVAYAIGIDYLKNVFIADISNDRVYKVDTSRIFHLLAGNGTATYAGDGGPATAASLYNPEGVTADACGNIYIADGANNHIRKIWHENADTTASIAITISASNDTVCAGSSAIIYMASLTGGGTSHTYYWYVNNLLVQTSASNRFIDTLTASDSVFCIVSSRNLCAIPVSARSNTIHSVVVPTVTPSISIAPITNDTICFEDLATFRSFIVNGGSSPTYQWYVNGSRVGSGAASFTYAPLNGDSIKCMLTSSLNCALPDTVYSNHLRMTVLHPSIPSISLSGPAISPIGSNVTITAYVTGAGRSYSLIWKNWGTIVATTTSNSFTFIKTLATDSITVTVASNELCTEIITSNGLLVYDPSLYVERLQSKPNYFEFFPNPISEVLTITGKEPIESVVITNIFGQVLYNVEFDHQLKSMDMSVGHLTSGIYLVKVNNLSVEKVVKQ